MNAFGLPTDSADAVCRIDGWFRQVCPVYPGKKRGQPFRITQSQLREVAVNIGPSAPKCKPYFDDFYPPFPSYV
jgi:hypothetical protein